MPNAQTSAFLPQYSVLDTISGAMYVGVPQNTLSLEAEQMLKPKSIILTRRFCSSMRIFSILMSL